MSLDLIQHVLAGMRIKMPLVDNLDQQVRYHDTQTNVGFDNSFKIEITGDILPPTGDVDWTIVANHDLAGQANHVNIRLNGTLLVFFIFGGSFQGGSSCPLQNGGQRDFSNGTINADTFAAAINNTLDVQTLEVRFFDPTTLSDACGGNNDLELDIAYVGNANIDGSGPSYIELVTFGQNLIGNNGMPTHGSIMNGPDYDYITKGMCGHSLDDLRKVTVAGFVCKEFIDPAGRQVSCLILESSGEVGGAIVSFQANGSCTAV